MLQDFNFVTGSALWDMMFICAECLMTRKRRGSETYFKSHIAVHLVPRRSTSSAVRANKNHPRIDVTGLHGGLRKIIIMIIIIKNNNNNNLLTICVLFYYFPFLIFIFQNSVKVVFL